MVIMNYNKYEDYIRIGHTLDANNPGDAINGYNCTDLQNFPTPATFGRTLHDVDVDAYTDLEGYTQRNRVRNDVEDITLAYSILSDEDEQYILNRIQPEYIYVELIDKKTRQKKVHKMYASDKEWDTFAIVKDENNVWHTQDIEFGFSLVEQ